MSNIEIETKSSPQENVEKNNKENVQSEASKSELKTEQTGENNSQQRSVEGKSLGSGSGGQHLSDTQGNQQEEVESIEEDLPIEDIDHLTEGYFEKPHIYGVRKVTDPLSIESLYNVIYELGIIPLQWPTISDPHFETRACLPESYYKNNDKERILLTFAENFRRQYILKYPKRRPLLLQAPNDCGLQKMVCTTIRPTWVRFPEMRSWEGCAHFVADYLDYEPLRKPVLLPERILSPMTVLKRQKGNCFEYATLLVSYLIGSNINAYVVFGYATREFTLGILNRRSCPEQLIPPEPEPPEIIPEKKYKVPPGPNFKSKHLINMEQKMKDKANKALEEERTKKEQKTKEVETPPPDDLHGWRVHAWVLVIPPKKLTGYQETSEKLESIKSDENQEKETLPEQVEGERKEEKEKEGDEEKEEEGKEGSTKENQEDDDKKSEELDTTAEKLVQISEEKPEEEKGDGKERGEDGEEGRGEEGEKEGEEEEEGGEELDDTPYYIEPFTGFRYEIDREEYLQVESIYNDKNYYVNLQTDRVPQSFNLRDKKSWLPFLHPIDNESTKKQFDMPSSWVEKLEITNTEFSERYPGGKKISRYKKKILEQYAPYSTMDGLRKRYITYDDYSYTKPIYKHEWFERRPDHLYEIHYDYIDRKIIEYFNKGREDYLKEHIYQMDREEDCVICDRELIFYHLPRFDHLSKITTSGNHMNQDFIDRDDKLYNRLIEFGDFFENQELHRYVMNAREKFHRNNDIYPANNVAIKKFYVAISEIHLQYHYEENFVTNSTRVFYKPNLMDTGGILSYVPEMTAGYVANPNSPQPRQLSLYRDLVEYMKEENEALAKCRAAEKILGDVIYLRCMERKMSADAVLLFDVERNEEAKQGIAAKLEAARQRKERELRGDYSPRSASMALRDYIEVILKRQNRIQQEYDRIVNKLNEDKIWFLTNQYIIKPQEEADYVKRREFMNFEVSTLEKRMERAKLLSKERFEHLQAIANMKAEETSQHGSERKSLQVEFEKKCSESDF